jgi:DNA-binding LacI/PurR family transcriptional regulator
VSHTTVSNAFARPDQLSPAVRDHVLATARALGYAGPDPVARSLKTGRYGAVGLVFSEDLPFAFSDAATTAACRAQRANLLLVATRAEREGGDVPPQDAEGDDLARESRGGLPGLAHAAVDGIVVYSLASDSPMLPPVLARRLPLVVIDQPRLAGVSFVGIDDEGAAYAAAAHLVALGHRRFAVASLKLRPDGHDGPATTARVATATYEVTAARLAGYRRALRDGGLDASRVPVIECARNDERRARDLLRPLFTDGAPFGSPSDERPTAVLAMSDRLARGAVTAVYSVGLTVPGDVAVIGFDDVGFGTGAPDNDAETPSGALPPLTTVGQPHAAKGHTAVALLSESAAGVVRMLPTELIIRASTAPSIR